MEFSKKLQELRNKKGLTQEQLANVLFVSRTAISKWESGRGYPSIDSLKKIAEFFSITVDELLSSNELLTLAEHDSNQSKRHFLDIVFGLLDICCIVFIFIPFFAQRIDGTIYEVSLLSLTGISPYLKAIYCVLLTLIILFGVLSFALQGCNKKFWVRNKDVISLLLSVVCAIVFTISLQPYPAIFLFVFSIIKVLILIKK